MEHTWRSDGLHLSLWSRSAGDRIRWGFRRFEKGADRFQSKSTKRELYLVHAPGWWSSRFRVSSSSHATFITDRLAGCELSFVIGSTCYVIRFGVEVWTSTPSEPGQCDADKVKRQSAKNIATRYTYVSTSLAGEMHSSRQPCLPIAAYSQLEVDVVDIDVPEDLFSFTDMHAQCRTSLRLAMDVSLMEARCSSPYRKVYEQEEVERWPPRWRTG